MNLPIWRFVDFSLSAVGGLLAIVRLVGFAFFGATNSTALAVPAIVMLLVVLLPFRVLFAQRGVLIFLTVLYVASYLFGGFDRMIRHGQYMPDLLEFVILCYFAVRITLLRREGLEPKPKEPGSIDI